MNNYKDKNGLFNYFRLKRKYNSLLIKYEALKQSVQDGLFEVVYKKINDDAGVDKLKQENKYLRKQLKTLKEIIKEGEYERDNSKKDRNKSSIRNKSRSRTNCKK